MLPSVQILIDISHLAVLIITTKNTNTNMRTCLRYAANTSHNILYMLHIRVPHTELLFCGHCGRAFSHNMQRQHATSATFAAYNIQCGYFTRNASDERSVCWGGCDSVESMGSHISVYSHTPTPPNASPPEWWLFRLHRPYYTVARGIEVIGSECRSRTRSLHKTGAAVCGMNGQRSVDPFAECAHVSVKFA